MLLGVGSAALWSKLSGMQSKWQRINMSIFPKSDSNLRSNASVLYISVPLLPMRAALANVALPGAPHQTKKL